MATDTTLSGAELVLIAQVPKAGGRWHQVHFNTDVGRQFFRLNEGEERTVSMERVDAQGQVGPPVTRGLVFSHTNRNYRIEFDFDPVTAYPNEDRPLVLVLELSLRRFRYLLLMPGDPGHEAMRLLNDSEDSIGKGVRRVVTTLDEVELRWPGCPLRGRASATE